jgi:hypothetical protein
MRLPRCFMITTFAVALGGAFTSSLSAASPFAGKWKFNLSKSKVTGTTDSVTAAGPDAWKFAYGSFSWTVKADGGDQPTPFGNTVSLQVVGPSKWQLTNKINGKLTSNDTWVLADDGQSMTRLSTGKHENGEAFSDVTKMKRTGGAKGFEGTWESAEFKGAPSEVDFEGAGDTGLILTVPADGVKINLKFDGKDYPVEGPRVPPARPFPPDSPRRGRSAPRQK